MTIIVSVKINDGIVMAADSASSFGPVTLPDGKQLQQTYQHANKIVNLRKDLPIGAMVTGSGNIGVESIDTLFKDLRRHFSHTQKYKLEPNSYTMQEIATKVREFLFEEKAKNDQSPTYMRLRICGYSAAAPLPENWEVFINDKVCEPPKQVQDQASHGIRWDGVYEPLNRLVLGVSAEVREILLQKGADATKLDAELNEIYGRLSAVLSLPAMPIQDAIDLARFLVETTLGYVRFSTISSKSVGGPIEIAAITKHEGFKWIQRKHFYESKLNPTSPAREI